MSGLTVTVTGPTGELGRPFVDLLERTREVKRIVGMARRPFDPGARGWRKTEYLQGDVLDRAAVDELVAGADAVVHLAFIVVKASTGSRDVNVEGSRNVFAAAAAAGVPRLVYASSVAAYGYPERDGLLTEDVPAEGDDRHPYSAQKAVVERVLAEALAGSATQAWAMRPCIVAGPDAQMLVRQLPYVQLADRVPGVVREALGLLPGIRPVLPDPGVPFQLVHHDDVATALRAGVLGRGEPGAYNLAGPGELRVRDLAEALGWAAVPVPGAAVEATAELLARLPWVPAEATWIEAVRRPVLMDTSKARRLLRWRPRHDARSTLRDMIAAARVSAKAR